MLLAHSQPLIKGAPLYPQVANRRPARDRYLAASEKLGHFQEDIMNLIIATEPDIISTVNKPSTRSSQTVKNPSNNDESQIISVAKVRVYPLEDSNGIYQVIVKEFDLNTTNFSWRNTIREQNGISTIDDLLCQGELSNRQGYFSEEAINCVASTWHGPDLVFICNLQYFLDSWVLIAMRQTKTIPGANAAPPPKSFPLFATTITSSVSLDFGDYE
ncbi:hypothetical protein OCU04_011413 [Sclerotinia nivalis]|uniref:Uncharacterized protein n=1 Tax=Sclerotinia nivalis TaxID=352851 RepID=A0A9X0ABG6_9HELO|nr:hypothetical protein OCU04_011413 [Sclerotinia nivalis]